MIAINLEYIAVVYLLYLISCILSLAIGSYIFAIASTKEIRRNIRDFNKVVMVNDEQTKPDKRSYLISQFSVFIHAHSTVKQLSIHCKWDLPQRTIINWDIKFISRVATDFSNVFQPIFMVLFSWSIIAICSLMLLIQIEIVEMKIPFLLIDFIEWKKNLNLIFLVSP